jgi:hypothetical protein
MHVPWCSSSVRAVACEPAFAGSMNDLLTWCLRLGGRMSASVHIKTTLDAFGAFDAISNDVWTLSIDRAAELEPMCRPIF